MNSVVGTITGVVAGATLFSFSNMGVINHSDRNIALDGRDVVAYFQNYEQGITDEGVKGSKEFASKYKDVEYHFSSEDNKELFESNPEKYLPAYGGWCAWAMSSGKNRVSVNYDTFLIAKDAQGEDRLYLFYNSWGNNTLEKWQEHSHEELVKKADLAWEQILEKNEAQKNN